MSQPVNPPSRGENYSDSIETWLERNESVPSSDGEKPPWQRAGDDVDDDVDLGDLTIAPCTLPTTMQVAAGAGMVLVLGAVGLVGYSLVQLLRILV